MGFELFLNALCLAFGPFTIFRLWKRRAVLEGAYYPPLPPDEKCQDEEKPPSRVVRFFQLCTRINMGLTGFFGVLFVALPVASLQLLGIGLDSGAVLMLQAYGCSLVFLSVLCYWFQTSESRWVISGLAVGNCVEDTLLAILLGVRTFQGHLNALGWIFTTLFVLEVLVHAVMLAGLRRLPFITPASPFRSTTQRCHEGSTP
jgi:hypothetical protein